MDDKGKRKLSVDEQIDDFVWKNVKFDLCTKKEAKNFLTYNNYYFKLNHMLIIMINTVSWT